MLRACLSKVKLRFHKQILDVFQYAGLFHWVIIRKVIAGLLYKVPFTSHKNIQCLYHIPYGLPTSVARWKLLRKQAKTGTSTSLIAKTH
jgi:hypothetical protein